MASENFVTIPAAGTVLPGKRFSVTFTRKTGTRHFKYSSCWGTPTTHTYVVTASRESEGGRQGVRVGDLLVGVNENSDDCSFTRPPALIERPFCREEVVQLPYTAHFLRPPASARLHRKKNTTKAPKSKAAVAAPKQRPPPPSVWTPLAALAGHRRDGSGDAVPVTPSSNVAGAASSSAAALPASSAAVAAPAASSAAAPQVPASAAAAAAGGGCADPRIGKRVTKRFPRFGPGFYHGTVESSWETDRRVPRGLYRSPVRPLC